MRLYLLLACCLLTMATDARASWEPYGVFAAIDLWNAHRGLVCKLGADGPLEIMQDSVFHPVLYAPVTQIAIQDDDRAWAVQNNTLYAGTNNWSSWRVSLVDSMLVDTTLVPAPLTLVRATPSAVFLYSMGVLYRTIAGDTLLETEGMTYNDSVFGIDYFSGTTLVALTSDYVSLSTDGGATWTHLLTRRSNSPGSVYIDTEHHLIYTSGDVLRVSADTGKTWNVVNAPPEFGFLNLGGEVFGARDCSGTFYISKGTSNGTNTDIMRSSDEGRTFYDLGPMPGPYFNYNGVRAWVFDRGATVYWAALSEFSGESLYFTRDGINGILSDSVQSAMTISNDTVLDTLCKTSSVPFTVSIASSMCSSISLDSITVVNSMGSIPARKLSQVLTGSSTNLVLQYSGTVPGIDSAVLRLWYHGLVWNFEEHSDFVLLAYSIAPPAILNAPDSIDFGSVQLGRTSGRELTIANEGCSPLRIDSIVSSDPKEFSVGPIRFPLFVLRDTSISIYVAFFPLHTGLSVESFEVGTSAGHRFIEVLGSAVSDRGNVRERHSLSEIAIVPNPAIDQIFVRGVTFPASYSLRDVLGRLWQEGTLLDGTLNISLPSGTYYFECGQQMVPFVVSKP